MPGVEKVHMFEVEAEIDRGPGCSAVEVVLRLP